MPQLLRNIDQIGRQKKRDVMSVEFNNVENGARGDYRTNQARKDILVAFDASGVIYEECAGYASETRFDSYRGQIYIDVPFDRADPQYQEVEALLENVDGTAKFEAACLNVYSLEYCMKNEHHDEPGFWDRFFAEF